MKKLRKILIMVITLAVLSLSLFGCMSESKKLEVYNVVDWQERASAKKWEYNESLEKWENAGAVGTADDNDWNTVNTVADNYKSILCYVKDSVINKTNKLLGISFVVVPEASGTMTFSFTSYGYTGMGTGMNLQQQTVKVTADTQKAVSFSFDNEISQILTQNDEDDAYGFYIEPSKFTALKDLGDEAVPADSITVCDGKQYYKEYTTRAIKYKISSITLIFEDVEV